VSPSDASSTRDFELQPYIGDFVNVVCTISLMEGSHASTLMVELNEAGMIDRLARVHYTYDLRRRVFGAVESQDDTTVRQPKRTPGVVAKHKTPRAEPAPVAAQPKAPAPSAEPKPRHFGALKALERGDMVWFAPLPGEEDSAAVYAGTVYAQEHKDAGFTPLKDPELYKWGVRVSAGMLATSLGRGARPVGKAAITAEELIAAAQTLQAELPPGFDQYLKPPAPAASPEAKPQPAAKKVEKAEKKVEAKKPEKPVKAPKPPHVLATEAHKRGFAISFVFDPEGTGKGKQPTVLCQEHLDVGITPEAPRAEEMTWGTFVTAEQWKEMLDIDYHPIGQLHPTERKKLAKMQKDEHPGSTMDYGNASHLTADDVSDPKEVLSADTVVQLEGCSFDGVAIKPGDSVVIQREGQTPLVLLGVDPAAEGAEQTVVDEPVAEAPRNLAAVLPPPVNETIPRLAVEDIRS
jgi:hypothetical protein